LTAVEERERVCTSNPACLLRLYYPCFNESACDGNCSDTCDGTWNVISTASCSSFCGEGTRSLKYNCRVGGEFYFFRSNQRN